MRSALSLLAVVGLLPLLSVTAVPIAHEVRAPNDYEAYHPVKCWITYDGGVDGGGDGGTSVQKRELDERCSRLMKSKREVEYGDYPDPASRPNYAEYGPPISTGPEPGAGADNLEKREATVQAKREPGETTYFQYSGSGHEGEPDPDHEKRSAVLSTTYGKYPINIGGPDPYPEH